MGGDCSQKLLPRRGNDSSPGRPRASGSVENQHFSARHPSDFFRFVCAVGQTADVWSAGQEQASPAPVFLFFVTRSFFPNQFVFAGCPRREVFSGRQKSHCTGVWGAVTFFAGTEVRARRRTRCHQPAAPWPLPALPFWPLRSLPPTQSVSTDISMTSTDCWSLPATNVQHRC